MKPIPEKYRFFSFGLYTGIILTMIVQLAVFSHKYHSYRLGPIETIMREHRITGSMHQLTDRGWERVSPRDDR